MERQIISSFLVSQVFIVASGMLCLQDGWVTVTTAQDVSFLPQTSTKYSFVSMPENMTEVERLAGSILVCRNASTCWSWLVKVLPTSHHNSNRTVIRLTSLDRQPSSTSPARYGNCSFSIPPCFISLQGVSSTLQRQYDLDVGGSLVLEFRASFVYFNELNASLSNSSHVPTNWTQNGTSANATDTVQNGTSASTTDTAQNGTSANATDTAPGRVPEDYMYRVPGGYLQGLVSRHYLCCLVDVYLEEVQTMPFEATLKIHVWQKGLQQGSTEVELSLLMAPASCGSETVFRTNVTVGCPPGKSLELLGVSNLANGSSPGYKLPVNYRPPSSEGLEIALSPHVYNADPKQPIRSSHFHRSKASYSLKQCMDKASRSECNCSKLMKASHNVAYSDCLDQAYEHAYGTPFALRFVTVESAGVFVLVAGNCSYAELNGRRDYRISDSATEGLANGWFTVTSGNTLTFQASGLYHFLFEIDVNDSFCDLSLYLMVFVTPQSITKSVEFFINILSSMFCGGSLMVVYLCYKHYNKYLHSHHHHILHHHQHHQQQQQEQQEQEEQQQQQQQERQKRKHRK